jgi:hypothetical protein
MCFGHSRVWCTSVIPALGRVGQEHFEFKASLRYTRRPCLKEKIWPNIPWRLLHPEVQGVEPRPPSSLESKFHF